MDELLTASALLRSALTRYMSACCDITKLYSPDNEKRAGSCTVMDCIKQGLQTVAGYEAIIQTAKATLARCRNASATTVPVNTLPPEALAQIFTLLGTSSGDCLTHDERGMFDQGDPERIHPMLPHTISHVCSRWRQIVVSLRELWSHIDIVASHQRYAKLLLQAGLYSARAGSVPLSLHICNPNQGNAMTSSKTTPHEIKSACYALAPTTERFRLDNSEAKGKGVSNLLSYFLRHAEPSLLRELCLIDHAGSGSTETLEYYQNSQGHDLEGWTRFDPLLLSTDSMDKRLRHIEVLWLRNILLPWSSHAYIGLSDLRLVADGDQGRDHIHITRMVKILLSCPRLRIFHCNIGVSTRDAPPTVSQVSLSELEVVNFHLMSAVQSTLLLAHIFPGDKPLELSLSILNDNDQFPGCFLRAPILAFLGRSRVTRLFLHKARPFNRDDYQAIRVSLAMLLSQLPPSVSTLGLNEFKVYHATEEELPSGPTQLDTVYLCSCIVDEVTFHALAQVCPLKKLMLDYDSRWWHHGGSSRQDKEQVAKLATITSCSWVPPERWTLREPSR